MKFKQKYLYSRTLIILSLLLTLMSFQAFAAEEDDDGSYVDQLIVNHQNSVILMNNGNEYVNPFHGNLNLKYVDLSLPGANGFDYNLVREYNSNDSYAFDIRKDSKIHDSNGKIRADIGAGWSFNIPFMEIVNTPYWVNKEKHIDTDFHVNLGEKGNFIVSEMGGSSTQAVIQGYENHNMNFYFADGTEEEMITGRTARYVYELTDGTKYYFAPDHKLIAMRDKYGNQISYYYTEDDNYYPRTPDKLIKLSKVVDSLGREILFNYTSTDLTVSVQGEEPYEVRYEFESFKNLTSLRPEETAVTLLDTDIVLKSVINNAGYKTNYTYQFEAGRENYGTTLDSAVNKNIENGSADNIYALISNVSNPGGLESVYSYEKSVKHDGSGCVEFFKIADRKDIVINGSTPQDINKTNYAYSISAGSEYDGYPNEKDPENFRIRVSVITDNKSTEYIADSDLKILEVYEATEETISREGRIYDDKSNLELSVTELSALTSLNNTMTTATYYEYDEFGRKINEWGPKSSFYVNHDAWSLSDYDIDELFALDKEIGPLMFIPVSDEFKKTYSYDDRYNQLLSIKYKEDIDTMIERKNRLTSDGKSVSSSEIYENSIRQSKVSYIYDNYGNVVAQTAYDLDFNELNTTHYDYNNGNSPFPVRVWTESYQDVDGTTHNGKSQSFTYDFYGNQISAIDGLGNEVKTEYDDLHRPIRVINPDNSDNGIAYNVLTNGFNIIQTDELNNQFKLNYDGAGRLVNVVDLQKNQVYVTNEYDALGRLVKSTDSLGTYSLFTYFSDGSKKTERAFSEDDVLLSSVDYKKEVSVEDNKYIKLTTEVLGSADAPTQKSEAYIDVFGQNIKNVFYKDGSPKTEYFTYDYIGRNITFNSASVADENLDVPYSWMKEYDYSGNVTKFFNANQDFATNVYNLQGQPVESYDYESNKSTTPYAVENEYDDLGRLIETRTPFEEIDGQIKYSVVQYKYDDNNNIIEQRVSNNGLTETESFSVKKFTYDNRNRLVMVKLENGSKTPVISQYYYNEIGRKLRLYTGLSSPLTITGLDQVSGTDSDYSVSKYEYDYLGNLTKYTDPLGNSEIYTYDNFGRLVSKTDRNGNTIVNTYDDASRLSTISVQNGIDTHTTSYEYYLNGLLKRVNANGYAESFTYNDMGLVTNHNYPDYFNSYTYNTSGNVSKVLSKKGIYHIQISNYSYDALDRMTTVSDSDGVQATYSYDANGNRNDVKYLTGSFGTNYDYNLANKVTSIDNFNDGSAASAGNTLTNVLSDYQYNYRLDGNKVSENDSVTGMLKSYTYDEISRLVNESKTMNEYTPDAVDTLTSSENAPDLLTDYSVDYTYDDYGNIATKIEGLATTTYSYDKNNRLVLERKTTASTITEKIFKYDANGNLISERVDTLSNVPAELLSEVAQGTSEQKIFAYNILNQQVKITTSVGSTEYTYNTSGMRASKSKDGDTSKFFWNGQNIIGEDKNDVITSSYLYGMNLVRKENKETSSKYYYFFNGHGDVIALTDDQGEVLTKYDYNAYGEFVTRGVQIDNPFTYFGQYYDKESGSFYLRARYYNPSFMRFTQEDSYLGTSDDPLSLNSFLYCVGNPIMYFDVSGHSPVITGQGDDIDIIDPDYREPEREIYFPDEVHGVVNKKEKTLYPNQKWGAPGKGSYSGVMNKNEEGRYLVAVAPKVIVPDYSDSKRIWPEDFDGYSRNIAVYLRHEETGKTIILEVYAKDFKAHSYNTYPDGQPFDTKDTAYFDVENGLLQTGIAYPNSSNAKQSLSCAPDNMDGTVIEFCSDSTGDFRPSDYELIKLVIHNNK